MNSAIHGAMDAFRAAGLQPRSDIDPNGKIIRFPTGDHGRDKNGWYVGYTVGPHLIVIFGCWQRGFKNEYRSWGNDNSKLTAEELAEFQARRKQAEELLVEVQEQAAQKAVFIWSLTKPAPTDFPYLVEKGIQAHGARITTPSEKYPTSSLVIPVHRLAPEATKPEISSLQFIRQDGSKIFMGGGAVAGGFFILGTLAEAEKTGSIAVCEGFATGASIHEATGLTVVIAFNSGNFKAVAEILRQELLPDIRILACADDDHQTNGNPGLRSAIEAAEAISGLVAIPSFKGLERGLKDSDFNDMARLAGPDRVKACIAAAMTPDEAKKSLPALAEASPRKNELGPGLLEQALAALAQNCDGAATKDGKGFNDFDAKFLKPHIETATAGGVIAASFRAAVLKRLSKYGRQLLALGFNVNQLAQDEGDRAATAKKVISEDREAGKPPSYAEIGKQLSEEFHWMLFLGRLHIYKDGFYQPGGERIAKERVQEITKNKASSTFGREVVYWLSTAHYVAPEVVDAGTLINVKNGLLDALTGELHPHTPDHPSTIRLPVAWDPNAHHPRFDQFLNEVLPDQPTRQVLEEALANLLIPDCRYEKATMLTGSGANGKSVFLSAVEAMLGKQNISNLALQEVQERFSTAELAGKLANVFADLPKTALEDSGTFKMLVSGDVLKAERKHQNPFTFANRAKLFFSANELPKTKDKTTAFWRRWIIVPFPNQFPEGDPRRDPNLKAKLQEPEALSYLLRLAVEGMRRLVARGHFIESQATKHAMANYKLESDTLASFVAEVLQEGVGLFVGKDELYRSYQDWCVGSGLHAMNKIVLGRELHRLIPNLCESKRAIGGKQFVRCWVNVGLAGDKELPPGGKESNLPGSSGIIPGSFRDHSVMSKPMDRETCLHSGIKPIYRAREENIDELSHVVTTEKNTSTESNNGGSSRNVGRLPMDREFDPGSNPGSIPEASRKQPESSSNHGGFALKLDANQHQAEVFASVGQNFIDENGEEIWSDVPDDWDGT